MFPDVRDSHMTDSSERENAVPWIADEQSDGRDHERQLDAITDSESDTITFVPETAEAGEVTTAWLTVDADHVVDAAEMH
jgi:hypothetical protein